MKRLVASSLVVLVGLAAACVGGENPASPQSGDGGTSSSGGPGSVDDSGADASVGRAFPLKLTALSTPQTSTANITLFFSVVDKFGEGVADLKREDFRYFEDAQEIGIGAAEYDFSVSPLTGQRVNIPSVLVLDLSQSVVDAGALEIVKKTATAIIDGMLPEQTLAIMSFADTVKQRAPLTADKTVLKNAVASITQADGASTNLYGAVQQAVGMWQDGFSGTSTTGQLTAGLAMVISDGDDTAAAVKLSDVIKARGNKRVVTVGVGDVKAEPLNAISSTGFHLQNKTFTELEQSIGSLTKKLSTLNRSIYLASYCSPKRAGDHNLVFTVTGNEVSADASCKGATFTPGTQCNIAGRPEYTEMCWQSGNKWGCCPDDAPYHCASNNSCYKTAEGAAAECGTSCIACGGTGQPSSSRVEDGSAIRVSFTATNYQSTQCPKFRGPECKALDTCCATLPKTLRTQCENNALSANGNESTCTNYDQQYCPTRGPQCTKQTTCCNTFGDQWGSQCWQNSTNETSCTQFLSKYCDNIGTSCTALRTCCANKPEPQRSTCEQYYIMARSAADEPTREANCTTYRANQSCPQ